MRTKFFFLTLLILCVNSTYVFAQDAGEPNNAKLISGGVLNGKATSLPKPNYPAAAKAVKAGGAVNVQVTVDEEGNVIAASAVSGHPLLRAASITAARQAKFSPTMLSGQAVKVTGIIVYNFVLPKETSDSKKMVWMGLAMFLTALKDLPIDNEANQILRDFGNEIPAEMNIEKSQFDKLARAKSSSEKGKVIDEIIASMRKNLSGTDVWNIDFGKQWGGAIGEAYKITDSNFRKDRETFIKNLQGMNWLLESPPKDISDETLEKIRAIASYNDETDAISPEYINDFFKSSLEFVQFMIDESKRGN